MPVIQREAIVPHTTEEMYQLVNGIEDYPAFITWCYQTQVLSRDEDEIRATLHFERSGLKKSFTTCNRLQKNKMIEMRLIDGPFKHLEGFWRFDALEDNHCRVRFDLEFEFTSKIMGLAFNSVFSQMANTLVQAFCTRADEVYGINHR